MIKVNNLIKAYRGITVVQIPELEFQTGEIIGLVGNNGAGKTTFFRLLLDLVRASKGEILSDGRNVAKSEDWKKYTAAYLDEGFLIGYLTPEEYFSFIGKLHQRSSGDVDDFLKSMEGFFDGNVLKTGKFIRDFSKGNQFKIGIAACLLANPSVLVLDEPFANLDPGSQIRLIRMLKDLQASRQLLILISSHDLNHVTGLCDRIVLMEKGKIIKDIDTTADTLQELESYFINQTMGGSGGTSQAPADDPDAGLHGLEPSHQQEGIPANN